MRKSASFAYQRGTVIVEYSMSLILLWVVVASAVFGLIGATRTLYNRDAAGMRLIAVDLPQVDVP